MKQLEGAANEGQEADGHRMGAAIVTPLRKRRLSGELYERDPTVEALIAELATLPREKLIARAAITKRADPVTSPANVSSISSARAAMTMEKPGSSVFIGY